MAPVATEHSAEMSLADRTNTVATDHSAEIPSPRHTDCSNTRTAQHMEVEFALEIIIPFLAYRALGLTMCSFKQGRKRVTKSGEHVHTWCQSCADKSDSYHGLALHEACSECTSLRTLSLLSVRWQTFCWDGLPSDHIWSFLDLLVFSHRSSQTGSDALLFCIKQHICIEEHCYRACLQ